jgi:hypothetical protein
MVAASLWVSVVVLGLLACCMRLYILLYDWLERQRASRLADEISRFLFAAANTKGELEAELELKGISSLDIQGQNPVRVSVSSGKSRVTRYLNLPTPIQPGSFKNPSKLKVLKYDFLLLVRT